YDATQEVMNETQALLSTDGKRKRGRAPSLFSCPSRYGPVEYLSSMARKCPTYDRCQQRRGMVKKVRPARPQPF
ncbi:MAG: hypothetical protein V3U07_07245, partial [Nitrospirales bacterium]